MQELDTARVCDHRGVLPKGAKSIEAGEIILSLGRDKLVLTKKHDQDHYTLQAGTASGILDVHRTWTDVHGVRQHETVFAITRDNFGAILESLSAQATDPRTLIRRLRVGWMARQNIGIAYGLDPHTDEEIGAVTVKRKRRLIPDEQRMQANINVPEYLEDIYQHPDGTFTLLHHRRRIGIGTKQTDEHGVARLRWIRLRDLQREVNRLGERLFRELNQSAIPPSEYRKHAFLRTPPASHSVSKEINETKRSAKS